MPTYCLAPSADPDMQGIWIILSRFGICSSRHLRDLDPHLRALHLLARRAFLNLGTRWSRQVPSVFQLFRSTRTTISTTRM